MKPRYWMVLFVAALFADGGLDTNEMRVVRATFEEIAHRVQAGQVIGQGKPQQSQDQPQAQQTPQEMNQNQEPMYAAGNEGDDTSASPGTGGY